MIWKFIKIGKKFNIRDLKMGNIFVHFIDSKWFAVHIYRVIIGHEYGPSVLFEIDFFLSIFSSPISLNMLLWTLSRQRKRLASIYNVYIFYWSFNRPNRGRSRTFRLHQPDTRFCDCHNNRCVGNQCARFAVKYVLIFNYLLFN